MLQVAQGDTGWDVFSLDYHVDGPIGTVSFTSLRTSYILMLAYLRIIEFNRSSLKQFISLIR